MKKCDKNNQYPNYNSFSGDSVLIPHVTFSRKGMHFCIYCGKESDTREHAPSKVFLKKPYPKDLPTLPACKKCNNGFSNDELYTEVYIDAVQYLSGYSSSLSNENEKRIYQNRAFTDAQNDLKSYFETGNYPDNKIIERILAKLALCHMVFELSEGYAIDDSSIHPGSVKYNFTFNMTENEKKEYNEFVLMNDKILPEVGSRVYGKIYVFQPMLNSLNSENKIQADILVMNWTDIQDKNYRYISWLEHDGTAHVKIVIHDFLYGIVGFQLNRH